MWWDDLPGWVEAGAAVLSMTFAGIAWWRSSVSKKARAAAINAEAEAARHLTAAEETASEVRRIADHLSGPPITGELHGEHEGVLRNRRDETVSITGVLNGDQFQILSIPDAFTIPPYGSLKFVRAGRHPRELVLQLADGRVLHVAL